MGWFDWFKKKPDPVVIINPEPPEPAHISEKLTASMLSKMAGCPIVTAQTWVPALILAAHEAQLDNAQRLAAFIAQVVYESNRFIEICENMNYSAPRLLQVFGKYFTNEKATEYAHNPERIANLVYANRIGNGPEQSGDGFRFRGRGLIQLTGRSNYRAAGKDLGIDLENNPELAEQPIISARVAGWYWTDRNLNAFADMGNIDAITYRINGGYNGKVERAALYQKALRMLA